jgi:hypothetical protein
MQQQIDDPALLSQECANSDVKGSIVNRTVACADTLARKHAAATLFNTTPQKLECVLCHSISESTSSEAPWKIAGAQTA